MKKIQLRKIIIKQIRKALKQDIYHRRQAQQAQSVHDWQFPMNVKFKGTENQSKWLSIDRETFDQIKDILARI